MPTMTTRSNSQTLLLALDLGNTKWKLGFTAGGPAQPPRMRTIPARDLGQLRAEIGAAKRGDTVDPLPVARHHLIATRILFSEARQYERSD